MQCRECNAELPAEARFCLWCGERVQPETPRAAAAAVEDRWRDLSHAACADHRDDFLRADSGSGYNRHGCHSTSGAPLARPAGYGNDFDGVVWSK